jgi:PiT family inorganic phosphate transporter
MHFFDGVNFGNFPATELPLVIWLLIAVALTFDFLNGLHDAANSVATVVSTRVLSPRAAVIWAAFFNFIAFLVFPLKVATTIQRDVIDPAIVDEQVIAATLVAACGWNLLTWYLGLPTSSSHALIGGMIGAALGKTGNIDSLRLHGLFLIVMFIFLAPLIGMVLGVGIGTVVMNLFRKAMPRPVDAIFRRGQLFSAACFSLGHGGNDAQKTMGIIFVLLIAASAGGANYPTPKEVPTEVVLACHLAMGLGTMIGGWRIVKTMGQRIIRLRPIDGFCAESAAAITLAGTTAFRGIPISTTHTITGAIVGVGSLKRLGAVRWNVAGQVVVAWILTIPGAAVMAAVIWWILKMIG